MFATDFLIAVAGYARGTIGLDAFEDAAAQSIVGHDRHDGAGWAEAVMLGIAEVDRGDITEDDLRERLSSMSPEWVPSTSGSTSAAQTVTLHENEAEIIVPAWAATPRAGAYA